MKPYYKITILILLLLGIGLRLSLFWFNPPQNSFDDHFEPVSLILQNGKIPAKDACWECNQPFMFYVGAAVVADIGKKLGASDQQLLKVCQFLPCLFGILILPIILAVLSKFPLSPLAKVIAFGTVCFLPRHIYMSAMFTNDTISYFFAALCVLFLFKVIEKNFSLPWILGLSILLSISIFTKYTVLATLPMVAGVFVLVCFWGVPLSRGRCILLLLLVMLVPLAFLSPYMLSNYKKYNNPLPTNLEILNVKLNFIPGSGINYLNFKPWEVIKTPVLTPDNVKSFWTVIQGGMWFDLEPKFLYFTDQDKGWWVNYEASLGGRPGKFPDPNKQLSLKTHYLGSGLITIGVFLTLLSIIGLFYSLVKAKSLWSSTQGKGEILKFVALIILFVVNAGGIINHSVKFQYFSHMKSAFMLVSLPTFAVFLGSGIMAIEKYKFFKILTVSTFIIFCVLVTLHITGIEKALFSMTPQEISRILMSMRYLRVF